MSLSYEPLWEMLDELNISKMEFAKVIGISNATLAKLGKNEPITLTTVDKICNAFECKIENVVQHVPDLLLEQKKSNFPITVGSIILVELPSDPSVQTSKSNEPPKPYVILEIRQQTINKVDTWKYIAAPLTTTPTHYLSIYFENVLINNKLSHGWISLDRLEDIPSKYFVRLVGKMPSEIIQKINKFLISVTELFKDDDNT